MNRLSEVALKDGLKIGVRTGDNNTTPLEITNVMLWLSREFHNRDSYQSPDRFTFYKTKRHKNLKLWYGSGFKTGIGEFSKNLFTQSVRKLFSAKFVFRKHVFRRSNVHKRGGASLTWDLFSFVATVWKLTLKSGDREANVKFRTGKSFQEKSGGAKVCFANFVAQIYFAIAAQIYCVITRQVYLAI